MKYNFGVLIPATSKCNPQWRVWEDSDLYTTIHNILSTNENVDTNTIRFYLYFDEDDDFYSNIDIPKNLNIDITRGGAEKGNVVNMWNILAEKAYWECEYLLQTGSDIKYIDDGWITASQNWLSKKDNIGVVGFTDLTRGGDADPKRLFTQSIVHRHHFLLFGWYYPPKLTNWYCDDWITFTYRMAGADYQLKHRIVNEGGNPRYTPKSTDNELVGNLINNEYCKIIYWRDLKPRVFKE